jgi:integrase/recombinase XerD
MDTITTTAPSNSLRERMLQDMTMRGFGEHTQKDYIRHVRSFAVFLGRSPDTATIEDLRRFQMDQHKRAISPATINGAVSALRFLFSITLKRPEMALGLVVVRCTPKLREVLSVEEAARLIEAAPGIKYKAALSVAYGAGLRVSEVTHLKITDIDSERMIIRVEQGKGRKDRNAMLSPHLLDLLRQWWCEGKRRGVMLPNGWLFPGRNCTDPISARQLNRAVHEAAKFAGIQGCRYPRHPSASGPHQDRHDCHLYQGVEQDHASGSQSARPHLQPDGRPEANGIAARLNRCAPRSRSPTSSGVPGPRIVQPMPGI